MARDFNILLTFAVLVDGSRGKVFFIHEAPPKQAKGGVSAKAAPLAPLFVQCGAESVLLAGCSSAEPVSSSALQEAKLIKSTGLYHILSVPDCFLADESILIGHTAFDDGESLSEKFVGNGDHSEPLVCLAREVACMSLYMPRYTCLRAMRQRREARARRNHRYG